MGNCWARADSCDFNLMSASNVYDGGRTNHSSLHATPITLQPIAESNSSQSHPTSYPRCEHDLSSSHLKVFSFDELKIATKNFQPNNLIGEGGFGYVYKGWIDKKTLSTSKPQSRMAVAIKKHRCTVEGLQGQNEWLAELKYLGLLHHPHIVELIGFCLDGGNLVLVYEFLSQGSLEDHLFRYVLPPLSWTTRIKVAVGAAKGLDFLHSAESNVVHRDFKSSNILLDEEFNAKISDFGLARTGPIGDCSHVSTLAMGTEGYAAPEHITKGHLSTKCDVYSYGVVLLELLTGRRAIDNSRANAERQLVDWAKPYLRNRKKLIRIMDTKLEGKYPREASFEVATLALKCINFEPKTRPKMSEVLGKIEKLQDPKL